MSLLNFLRNMFREKVYFAKLKEGAIIPSKSDENAGYDIYACFDEESIIIQPHETKMIPTGIISAFSSNYYFQLKERGSTGTKGFGQRAGVIDSGYRGEWLAPITNHNDKKDIIITKANFTELELKSLSEDYIIYPYTKAICQAIFVRVPKTKIIENTVEEILAVKSTRGDGKLGSSGK